MFWFPFIFHRHFTGTHKLNHSWIWPGWPISFHGPTRETALAKTNWDMSHATDTYSTPQHHKVFFPSQSPITLSMHTLSLTVLIQAFTNDSPQTHTQKCPVTSQTHCEHAHSLTLVTALIQTFINDSPQMYSQKWPATSQTHCQHAQTLLH